jgi:hypothetical protein
MEETAQHRDGIVGSILGFGPPFLIQLLLAIPATFALSFLIIPPLPAGPNGFVGAPAMWSLACGLVVGGLAGWFWPRLCSSGRWIWVLPATLFAVRVVKELSQYLAVPQSMPGTLFDRAKLPDTLFVTLPAAAALGYSLGIGAMPSLHGARRAGVKVLRRRAMWSAGCGSALVLTGIVLLWQTEKFLTGRLDGVKATDGFLELELFPTAESLCAGVKTGVVRLRTHTLVKSLERKSCRAGATISSFHGRPGELMGVERVRVLTGPSTGFEGWVPAKWLEDHRP